jgi:hypothetical protein
MYQRNPFGAKLDKIHTKFRILKFFPDERRKSPCSKIIHPKTSAGSAYGAI